MSAWAADYIGKPWVNGAAGPEAFDCWGLVRHVYSTRYGIALPAVDVDAHAPLAVRHAFTSGSLAGPWQPVALYAEGDAILMSHGRHPHHVGLWLANGCVLHAVEGAGVLAQRPQSLAAHGWRILGAYRRQP